MRMGPQTVTLGERAWRIRPLTLAQVQAIEPLLARAESVGTVAAAVAILRVALAPRPRGGRRHPRRGGGRRARHRERDDGRAAPRRLPARGGPRAGGSAAWKDRSGLSVRVDWSALYARLMAGAGYTPDAIDAMPVQDVLALLRHWRDHPPTHEILAAVHRVTRATPAKGRTQSDDPSGLGALIARHPDGVMRA